MLTVHTRPSLTADIVVVGAGSTGLSAARDACLRGFRVVVLDQAGLANGATGRYHGLLHSGARYICHDPAAAHECAAENQTLRRLLPAAITDCGGYMLSTASDPPDYAEQFWQACQTHNLPVSELSLNQVYRQAPLLTPHLQRAFATADATCDSFLASQSLAADIQQRGVELRYHWRVLQVLQQAGQVQGVLAENQQTGEQQTILARWLLNCAGAWVGQLAALAGCPLPLVLGKGVLLAFHSQLFAQVINRCRPPADGDIFVPIGNVTILGTTDTRLPDSSPDGNASRQITPAEVQHLLALGEQLLPTLRQQRLLRAWSGVRALLADPAQLDNRTLTRSHNIINHAAQDGLAGMLSIVGGKLTTMRQMAADLLDQVCQGEQTTAPCQTATTPLLPPDRSRFFVAAPTAQTPTLADPFVCECEHLPLSQIQSIMNTDSFTLSDLRRNTRLAMGCCQGGLCIYRAAGVVAAAQPAQAAAPLCTATQYWLQAHWYGQAAVLFGSALQQAAQNAQIYHELLGLPSDVPPCST